MSLNDIPIDLLIKYGVQILGAVVILGVGLFLARSVGNMTDKWLQRQDMEPPIRLLLVRVAKLLVIGLTLSLVNRLNTNVAAKPRTRVMVMQ